MNMKIRTALASVLSISALSCLPVVANADALTVSCQGNPSATAITWSASTTGGSAPVAFLWGSGATTSPITISAAPGAYSMTIQATDASSTVATSSCASTIAWPIPVLSSFTATPSHLVAGQSATLSWNVGNASSTSIAGLGTVLGNATSVSPTVTTTYMLTATNPSGAATATTTVYVTATSTQNGATIAAQIQSLLAQIRDLQAQIMILLHARAGTSTAATTTPSSPGNGHAYGHEKQCEKQEFPGFLHSILGSLFWGGCADVSATSSVSEDGSRASVKTHLESRNSIRIEAGNDRDSDD